MSKSLAWVAVSPALAACASIPDVEYRYFPARATTLVTLNQTIECNFDKTAIVVTNTPTVITTYSSDRSREPFTLRTRDLRSTFADGDVKFEWFDDGRLKSVNQSSTGQGESIVKAAMTFLAPVIGGAGAEGLGGPKLRECDSVAAWNGGKPIGIVYERALDLSKSQAEQVLELSPSANTKTVSDAMHKLLGPRLPRLEVKVGRLEAISPLVEIPLDSSDTTSVIAVKLNGTALAPLEVLVSKYATWSGKIVVPTTETYVLPIPKPKLFGKQGFTLTLNDAGGISSMGFTTVSGTAGAFNAMNSVSSTISPSESTTAAAIKSEADVIAQTQRLAACQAKPADCK